MCVQAREASQFINRTLHIRYFAKIHTYKSDLLANFVLWHQRFAHVSPDVIKSMAEQKMSKGIKYLN